MLNNSIKSNLTKEDIISDIRLTLGADINKKNVYVIVEGGDDIKFLRAELNDLVYLYESYDGKSGVDIIVGEVFRSNKRVIGIRDRDYSNLVMGENEVFVYDNCCMEMMFVEDEETFNKIYYEFYHGEAISNQLRLRILSELRYLSCIRKLNEEKEWKLNLKAVSVSNAFEKVTCKINNNKININIKKVNGTKFDEIKCNEVDLEFGIARTIEDLLLITQGHDFAKLFATICNVFTNKGISGDNVEKCLRCSFTHFAFKKTRLFEALDNYQKCINIDFLVA